MTPKHSSITVKGFTAAIFFTTAFGGALHAQTQPQRNFPAPGGTFNAPAPQIQLPPMPTPVAITPNGQVVEDVIARVNDQIITRTEYERSVQQLIQDGQQQQASQADVEDHLHNLLRDQIDQKLLLSKGKELGITGDAEVIRQLNDIRLKNHLDSMEALEKAAAQQGISFEDFKQGIRNQVIQQTVVREEVGRRLQATNAQEQAFYTAHAKEFALPEQVHLSEILIPTAENASDADITAAQAKADAVAAKIAAGANFAETAKTASGGPTANAGGDLGDFKRGTLGDVLEKATFSLPVGGNTAPIRTRQGFVILHVDSHQQEGVAPFADVEPQVQEALYMDALQPALRAYLTKARNEAYVDIKPGFVDTGSASKSAKPLFTAYAPPPVKKKVVVKQKAEQEKAARAAADLAAAREKVAEKQAARDAEKARAAGIKNVNMPVKPKKIHREKIRYGQAPRNALPAGVALTSENVAGEGTPLAGVAPGVAMAANDSTTTISSGTGTDADADPLAPQAPPEKKSRFSQRETEKQVTVDQTKLAKAEAKATTRPVPATNQQTATEKLQATPLGLNGDTVKKQPKPRRKKGDPKERLKEAPKAPEAAPVAPTANPNLIASPTASAPPKAAPSFDQTTLPSTTSAPGATAPGQPIPAATSATPGAPQTVPSPR